MVGPRNQLSCQGQNPTGYLYNWLRVLVGLYILDVSCSFSLWSHIHTCNQNTEFSYLFCFGIVCYVRYSLVWQYMMLLSVMLDTPSHQIFELSHLQTQTSSCFEYKTNIGRLLIVIRSLKERLRNHTTRIISWRYIIRINCSSCFHPNSCNNTIVSQDNESKVLLHHKEHDLDKVKETKRIKTDSRIDIKQNW